MTVFYPDWSNNNWGSVSQAIAACDAVIHQEGYSAICHKVSEGDGYADPYWPPVRDWCNQNNVPVIGYHYVRVGDADGQVGQWNANGGGSSVMLDFEDGSGDIDNFWAIVQAFNRAGINVTLSYLPHWYWQNIGSPDLTGVPGLVSSSYFERGNYASNEYNDAGGDAGQGWTGYGNASPVVWQFTDGALMAGFSADANAFRGNTDQLRALFGGAPIPGGNEVDQATADQIVALLQDIQTQLRGPNLGGWPQLGQNPNGQNLTVVDALADVKDQVFGTFAQPKGTS